MIEQHSNDDQSADATSNIDTTNNQSDISIAKEINMSENETEPSTPANVTPDRTETTAAAPPSEEQAAKDEAYYIELAMRKGKEAEVKAKRDEDPAYLLELAEKKVKEAQAKALKDEEETAPSDPPAIDRASGSPALSNSPAEAPPKKNALFSMWGEKTKGSAPLGPNKPSSPNSKPAPYTGKRWTPPQKKVVAGSSDGSKPPSLPLAPGPIPAVAARAKPPVKKSWEPKPKSYPTDVEDGGGSIGGTPGTPTRSPTRKSSEGSGVVSTSTPPRDASSPGSPKKVNPGVSNLEHELEELRALKKQLQISAVAAGVESSFKTDDADEKSPDKTLGDVHIKDLKEDLEIDGIERKGSAGSGSVSRGDSGKHKKKKNSMSAYWQQKTAAAEPLKPTWQSSQSDGKSQAHRTPSIAGVKAAPPASAPMPGRESPQSSAAAEAASVEVGSADNTEIAAANAAVEGGGTDTATLSSSAVTETVDNTGVLAAVGMAEPEISVDTTSDGRTQSTTHMVGATAVAVAGTAAVIPVQEATKSPEQDEAEVFKTLVTKLVREVMPTEIDHVNELIEEYEGRESELLDTLSAMREDDELIEQISTGESPTNISNDSRSGRKNAGAAAVVGAGAVGAVALAAVGVNSASVGDEATERARLSQHFKDVARAAGDLESATGGNGDDSLSHVSNVSASTERTSNTKRSQNVEEAVVPNNDSDDQIGDAIENYSKKREDMEESAERSRRIKKWTIIGCILFLILAGVAAALGVVFGTSDDDGDPSSAEDGTTFIGQGEIPKNDGKIPTITRSPTPSPNSNEELIGVFSGDNYDPNAPISACNTPADNPQNLGIGALNGNYPKVAIDGQRAIVASGSGYVSFFAYNPTSKQWERAEVFGTMVNVGDVASVAISGNYAVIGAPSASTDMSADREEPLISGAIYIYERTEYDGKWKQLKGAYIPDEYKVTASKDDYQMARFGQSVDIDGELIVVGAPEENGNRGSITVFRFDDEEEDWVQVEKIEPDLCGVEFFGYSVKVYKGMVAASADCDTNIVLHKYDVTVDEDGFITGGILTPYQDLQFVSKQWGAVSSIAMSWNDLIYSTVSGGLFVYTRQTGAVEEGVAPDFKYFRSQEMAFDSIASLYEYPVDMDANMLMLAVENDVYIYTQDQYSKQWTRENVVLKSNGDYAGYVGADVAVSDGRLMISNKQEVDAYDFTGCARASAAPSVIPTFSPTVTPTVTPGSPGAPTCIAVNLEFDSYPADTSWVIEDVFSGSVVERSPAFDANAESDSTRVCLPDGTYAFIISDVYQDGMCCQWGDGSYEVTSEDGDVIASGGEFGASERTEFEMPFDPQGPIPATPSPTARPTPSPTQAAVPVTPEPTPSPTPNPTPSPTPNPVEEEGDCYTLDVTVNLDQYAPDTTWEIIPQGESLAIYNSIPYDASLAFTEDTQSVCLPEGTYDFTIYDVYGDGICCNWGEGSYELAFDGNVVASGGEFGASETIPFSTPSSGSTPNPSPTPVDDCYDVSIYMQFDMYAQDTSWDISQGGNIVVSSPPFAPGTTEDTQELCLPPGDYVFTIYDVYGDGMCCNWGEGSYRVVATNNQVVIKEGGQFGPSESTAFSLPTTAKRRDASDTPESI